ncbi:MAG: DbpA RNA binding domain-containing protein, partial [Tissierellaceae bacterium]
KLRDIQRYTKTKIKRQDLPTLKDIERNYTTTMLEKIKREIDNEDLSKYEKILESLLQEDYTSFDIGAALLKFYMEDNRLDGHKELDMVDNQGKYRTTTSLRRIHINIGKRKGISPRHILAAIVESGSIPKKLVGNIDLYDKFTFVEIPGEYVEDIIASLNGTRIKGARVNVEIAKPKRK